MKIGKIGMALLMGFSLATVAQAGVLCTSNGSPYAMGIEDTDSYGVAVPVKLGDTVNCSYESRTSSSSKCVTPVPVNVTLKTTPTPASDVKVTVKGEALNADGYVMFFATDCSKGGAAF